MYVSRYYAFLRYIYLYVTYSTFSLSFPGFSTKIQISLRLDNFSNSRFVVTVIKSQNVLPHYHNYRKYNGYLLCLAWNIKFPDQEKKYVSVFFNIKYIVWKEDGKYLFGHIDNENQQKRL